MARLELILQAASPTTHADAIRTLLNRLNPKWVLISVAFVREEGVEALAAALKPCAAKTRFFVGVRNDITSVQGIKRLLALKAEVYAVDTGSRDTIFHPKLYLITGRTKAGLIIGSANLTFQGLYNNIEASVLVTLDLTDEGDRRFVQQTRRTFYGLLNQHPQHVFAIKNEKHADELFLSGRLADETLILAPTPASLARKGGGDALQRMKLHRVVKPRIKIAIPKAGARAAAPAARPTPARPTTGYYLVWESNELSERDLNVPTGPNTNRTGSMLLKKGATENIDQRHFFRDEIFNDLKWARDPRKPHLERAVGTFELVIKNLNYGRFSLRLTHNTDTSSKTYKQNNAMTSLHWNRAISVIARRDLLGRTMYLYRKDTDPPEFLFEID